MKLLIGLLCLSIHLTAHTVIASPQTQVLDHENIYAIEKISQDSERFIEMNRSCAKTIGVGALLSLGFMLFNASVKAPLLRGLTAGASLGLVYLSMSIHCSSSAEAQATLDQIAIGEDVDSKTFSELEQNLGQRDAIYILQLKANEASFEEILEAIGSLAGEQQDLI